MMSFTAFGRRLMLSLLVAFWTISLVQIAWKVILDHANTSEVGFADLYAPSLIHRWAPAVFLCIQMALGLVTIGLAIWEIRHCHYHPPEEGPPQQL